MAFFSIFLFISSMRSLLLSFFSLYTLRLYGDDNTVGTRTCGTILALQFVVLRLVWGRWLGLFFGCACGVKEMIHHSWGVQKGSRVLRVRTPRGNLFYFVVVFGLRSGRWGGGRGRVGRRLKGGYPLPIRNGFYLCECDPGWWGVE